MPPGARPWMGRETTILGALPLPEDRRRGAGGDLLVASLISSRARPWLALPWLPPSLPGSDGPLGDCLSQKMAAPSGLVGLVSVGSPAPSSCPPPPALPALVSSTCSCWLVGPAQMGLNQEPCFLAPGSNCPRSRAVREQRRERCSRSSSSVLPTAPQTHC